MDNSLLRKIESRLLGEPTDLSGLDPEKQLELIMARTEHVYVPEELLKKLKRGQPLNVKFGIDPTSVNIHIGHYVVLRKMRLLQRLGHTIQFLIGSFTAMIGDPSDKEAMRVPLSKEDVEANFADYWKQVEKFFLAGKVEQHKNGDWFFKMGLGDFLPLMGKLTVSQMLERDNFKKRYEKGNPIGIHEFVYPLLQGYDSVPMQADIEMGGTDQVFNMLRARDIQPDFDQEPEIVITMPLLIGTDGRKMSKSYGNTVPLTAEPAEAYGKLMSTDDENLEQYAKLLTDMSDQEWDEIAKAMQSGLNPKDVKMLIARLIVSEIHSREAAEAAEKTWIGQFSGVVSSENLQKEIEPFVITEEQFQGDFTNMLIVNEVIKSRSEGRRLFEGGAIKRIAGSEEIKIDMGDESFKKGINIYKIGKKRFICTQAQ